MQFRYLIDCQDAMPTIASWYFRQWGHLWQGATHQSSLEMLHAYLNRDSIPFILLGLVEDDICAVAQLKHREMENIYPEKEHWLGGVFVPEKHRGCGYGPAIVEHIAQLAPGYGVTTLYLQTERLGGGFYTRLGWRSIETAKNHGLEVLVMERHLDERNHEQPCRTLGGH